MALATIPTRDQVPVEETWDVSALYQSEADWDGDVQRVRDLRDEVVALRGTAGESVAALARLLDRSAALEERLERLYVYAMLRRDENTADADALGRFDRIATLATEIGEATAFLTPEILAIPEAELRAWLDDPALAQHRHNLEDIDRSRPHVRSAEIEALLAAAGDVARGPQSAFTALDNADLKYGAGHDEEGNEIELTKARVARILQSRNRPARQEASEKLAAAYEAHKNTLAALHGTSVRKDVFYARAHNHPSAVQAALFDNNIPVRVYDALIEAVHEALPAFTRYLNLRRRVLGVDNLAPYDLNVPLAELAFNKLTFPEATQRAVDALTPLGERYAGDLRRGLTAGRWVDVHETANKRSGGYSVGAFGAHPYILMNWSGTRDDLYTLIHEAGHAMHSFYSLAAQPYVTAHYTIFVAEVASTVNETLLTWHLLDRAGSDTERFAVLAQFLDDTRSLVFAQTMYAEFERWTHAQVEAGAPLTAEGLTGEWRRLYALYYPTVELTDAAGIGWARIPHFYRGFYVYQYATGLCAAIALARAIREEGQPAIERYLTLLASGGADYSIELLRRAGVDMTTPGPVRAALAEFATRVDEATALFDTGNIPTHGAAATQG
ncbi:MAG: oligoendopeptidase F [Thermomicrobiales bacterium]